MGQGNFKEKIRNFSDHALYTYIKDKTIEDHLQNKNSTYVLEPALAEAEKRQSGLYNKALEDAWTVINDMERKGLSGTGFGAYRTEFMNGIELGGMIVKYADKSPKSRQEGIFGIDKSSLMIFEVDGNSMKDMNINQGDTLFVDTSQDPESSDIVVAELNDEVFVKRFITTESSTWLVSENRKYEPYEVQPGDDLKIKGVVKKVLHEV